MLIRNKNLRVNLISISFYGVPLALYIFFFILPSVASLLISFTSWDGFTNKFDFVAFSNYIELFNDKRFYASVFNTFQITIIYTLLVNALAILLAVMADNIRFLKNFFKSCFFVPYILAPVIIGFVWTFVLNYNFGVLNSFFDIMGLEFLQNDWIGSAEIVRYSITAVLVWNTVGFYFVVYLAALQSIPTEIIESSMLDGANGFKKFFYITLPLLSNASTICLTLSLIGGIKLFDLVFALTYGGPGFSSETITLYIYNTGFISNRNGYGSAVSVVMFAIILMLTITQMKFLKSREVEL